MDLRSFIAVELDEGLRRRVAAFQAELARVGSDVKWVEVENLHVTLKFLGDVDDADLPRICQIMDKAVAGRQPFTLWIEGAGSFPPGRPPRTVWVGAREEPPQAAGGSRLAAIYRNLDQGLQAVDVPPERREFVPHVTLGRVRSGRAARELAAALAGAADRQFGEQEVTTLTLFESSLDPEGPTYTPLYRAVLGKH